MRLKWHDRCPVSWLGYTDFEPRDSRQGKVWEGRSSSGQRAFLKMHHEAGPFHREHRAYTLLQNRGIGATCLGVDETVFALLLSDAGTPVTVEHQRTVGFANSLWAKLQRMHDTPTPADAVSAQQALQKRWARLGNSLAEHINPALRHWVTQKIHSIGDHQRGWTHRDLRPENVVIHNGEANVIDLGQMRPDFRIFDAVPFFADDWSPSVSAVILSEFEDDLGRSMMLDLPLFAVLYFLGSVEQLVRCWHPDDEQRTWKRYRAIQRQTDAPLNFDDFFTQIT